MSDKKTSTTTTTTRLLAAVVVLQGLILVGQWTGGGGVLGLRQASAQIPDAGGQRQALVEEMRSANAKLDKIAELLRSGEVQVKVAGAENKR